MTKTAAERLDPLFQTYNTSDAPGLIVGVARGGRTIYRRAYGLASLEHGVANTPATRMRIGSTSKHFTCLAALLLAEDGKLDIDEPSNRLLPELPALSGMPTLRQLMTHTSGYRCHIDLSMLACGLHVQSAGRGFAALVRQSNVNFAPGEGLIYCNGGYHLLSIAIERACGMPFEQFLKERIFLPLGMHDTASIQNDMEIVPGIAAMHLPKPDGGWRRGIFVAEDVRGEGAIVSTIDDMLRWMTHLRGPKIVGQDQSWKELFTPARLNNGLVSTYALGLMMHDYRGVDVIQHAGGVVGGTCQMMMVPAHDLDIIILANGGPANVGLLSRNVIDALLGDDVLSAPAAIAGVERFPHLPGAWYHADESGALMSFSAMGDKLGLSLFNMPAVANLRDEGALLRLGLEDLAMGPLSWTADALASGPDGKAPKTIQMNESGRQVLFSRLPDTRPSTLDAGQALAGLFHCRDLDADAKVSFEGDKLVLRIHGGEGTGVVELTALSDRVFAGAVQSLAPGYGCCLTAIPAGGSADGFFITTGRTRKLAFERRATR